MLGISPSLFKSTCRLSSYRLPVYRDVSTGTGCDEAFVPSILRKPLDAPYRLNGLGVCCHTCALID